MYLQILRFLARSHEQRIDQRHSEIRWKTMNDRLIEKDEDKNSQLFRI
jgi:hypothetical protein